MKTHRIRTKPYEVRFPVNKTIISNDYFMSNLSQEKTRCPHETEGFLCRVDGGCVHLAGERGPVVLRLLVSGDWRAPADLDLP